MRAQRVPVRDIAAKLNVPKSTIHKHVRGVFALLDHGQLAAYREYKPALMEAAELKMLSACMDDAAIDKASLNNRAYTLTQVHQMRRLEAGQSTANIALHELVERVERSRRTTTGSDRGGEKPSGDAQVRGMVGDGT